jgi:hypothetical protein
MDKVRSGLKRPGFVFGDLCFGIILAGLSQRPQVATPLPIVIIVLVSQLTFDQRISVSAGRSPVSNANRIHGT